MKYYFKTSDDNEFGPTDEGQIRAWLEQGRMNQDSLVRTVDSEEWRPLNDYSELMALLAPSSSAPPSPTPPPQADVKQNDLPPTSRVTAPDGLEPHRGTLILILGILSLTVCGFFTGIPAWIMGKNDLAKIKAGQMDPEGLGTSKAGMICGMINCILTLVCGGFYLVIIIIAVIAENS